VALNDDASIFATVCRDEDKVKLWDVKHGPSTSDVDNHFLTHPGTPLQHKALKCPFAALFCKQSPNKVIVACRDDIFIFDMSTQSVQSFSSTPKTAWYGPHALALSDDDAVLVAGNYISPSSVCGYDTASLERLWIFNAVSHVSAVCMLGVHVVATVYGNPTLILDRGTGALKAALQKTEGSIWGLGVIEGLFSFFLDIKSYQISKLICTSPCCSTSSTSKPSLYVYRWRCGTGSQSTACRCDWLL
jgi:hypothetical protein